MRWGRSFLTVRPDLRSHYQCCGVEAVEAGVGSAHMVDGRIPHVLLLELFTDLGIGTMVLPDGGVAADGRGVEGTGS